MNSRESQIANKSATPASFTNEMKFKYEQYCNKSYISSVHSLLILIAGSEQKIHP